VVTILVSGSGTGVGKTRVTAALARAAARAGKHVQIVKPVQTGIASGKSSDADDAAVLAGIGRGAAHTLRRYPAALAPISAATAAGLKLNLEDIFREIQQLPSTDIRLIEGAGGLAAPLFEAGYDWWNFALQLQVNAVVLVVPDQLGAINQARLVYHYFLKKKDGEIITDWEVRSRSVVKSTSTTKTESIKIPDGGIFLNALKAPPPEVAGSTRETLADCEVPVWGELATEAIEPRIHQPLAGLLGLA